MATRKDEKPHEDRCILILKFIRIQELLKEGEGSQTGVGEYYFTPKEKIDRSMGELKEAINGIVSERGLTKHCRNQAGTLNYLQEVMNGKHNIRTK